MPITAGELAKAAFNNGYEEYGWDITGDGMRYDIYSPAKNIQMHILLSKEGSCSKLLINSEDTEFEVSTVRNSKYVKFTVSGINDKKVSFEIIF